MKDGIDYRFRDDMLNVEDKEATCPIEMLFDPFVGVIYRYTTVSFEMKEDGIPKINFDYEIIKTNDLSMMTLRKNEKFNKVLGLIINAMLIDLGGASDATFGTSNNQEPDTEGRLHEESPSVPKG